MAVPKFVDLPRHDTCHQALWRFQPWARYDSNHIFSIDVRLPPAFLLRTQNHALLRPQKTAFIDWNGSFWLLALGNRHFPDRSLLYNEVLSTKHHTNYCNGPGIDWTRWSIHCNYFIWRDVSRFLYLVKGRSQLGTCEWPSRWSVPNSSGHGDDHGAHAWQLHDALLWFIQKMLRHYGHHNGCLYGPNDLFCFDPCNC